MDVHFVDQQRDLGHPFRRLDQQTAVRRFVAYGVMVTALEVEGLHRAVFRLRRFYHAQGLHIAAGGEQVSGDPTGSALVRKTDTQPRTVGEAARHLDRLSWLQPGDHCGVRRRGLAHVDPAGRVDRGVQGSGGAAHLGGDLHIAKQDHRHVLVGLAVGQTGLKPHQGHAPGARRDVHDAQPQRLQSRDVRQVAFLIEFEMGDVRLRLRLQGRMAIADLVASRDLAEIVRERKRLLYEFRAQGILCGDPGHGPDRSQGQQHP